MLRSDDTIALIDFGLAKRMRLRMELTDDGEIFGTPYYMSPEQGHGNGVDHRSDIYSLGVIFYEMLTGQRLFSGETATDVRAESLTLEEAPSVDGGQGWSEPILFYPDGSASTATVVLKNEYDRSIELSLRGLTGVITVGEIYSAEEL